MEVVIFIGLQAAGKSTFYRIRYIATHIVVSKDLLRNNRRPQRRQMQLISEALRAGRSVVVDNTHPTPEDRAPLVRLAQTVGARVVSYYFESHLADCLARNRVRSGRACVPERAIFATKKRLMLPRIDEGFDQLFHVAVGSDGDFMVRDWKEEDDEIVEFREADARGGVLP